MSLFPSPSDQERFAKFLRLLGSNSDGERAVAARKATDFLTLKGLDWHAVADALVGNLGRVASFEPRHRQPEPTTLEHQVQAAACLASGIAWKEHELDFLTQLRTRSRPLTDKQKSWLGYLMARAVNHQSRAAA